MNMLKIANEYAKKFIALIMIVKPSELDKQHVLGNPSPPTLDPPLVRATHDDMGG